MVSNLRLAIDQPAEHAAAYAAGDPGTSNGAQGYAAHYCSIPTEVDPKVVACSFIASGLRVFDISDLVHPKEIAYYVAPPQPRSENGYYPATLRCQNQRSARIARSGSPMAPAASTCSRSTRACGPDLRRGAARARIGSGGSGGTARGAAPPGATA